MSDAAAFEATYSDWRLVKGRKVVQVVLEVPLEKSALVFEVLGGMPNVAAEVWVGVARLNQKVGSVESLVAISAEHRITPGGSDATYVVDRPALVDRPVRAPPPLNVGKDSSTPEFIGWLSDYRRIPMDRESTAKFVRAFCEVKSRKDIVRGSPAEQKWNLLYSAFLTDNPPP